VTGLSRAAAGAGLAALLAVGCATRPAAEDPAAWTSGRLALQVEASADRPASSLSADFDLRGDGRRGELVLTSAIGTRIARARWTADEAVLDAGQGEVRYPDLETLSREALGEALPLRALPSWLAGRAWEQAPSTPRAGGFEQLGWTVGLADFPAGRVQAVREAAPRVVVRVRLERPAT
jgi:outer membrane lipoprotein LolB